MNKINILTNNVLVIGFTTETEFGYKIEKPFSIQGGNGNDFMLTPLFEAHIGQNVPEIEIKSEHILASVEAENNDLLTGYLQKISGIDVSQPSIILG